MPVYQYQGKHYDLPDGLSPEQAKAKIQTHLSGEQSSRLVDKAKGLGEAALMTGTGALASVTGLVPAALQSADALSHGEAPDFEHKYANAMQRMTYEPKTEKGQDYGEEVSDFVNRNLIPIAPLAPMGAGLAATMKSMKAGRMKPVTRGVDPNALIAKLEATEDSPQLASRRTGTQGNLFPDSKEGLASPYDAGTVGTTEPIAPQRQARQMGFNFGMDSIPVTKEGQGVLSAADAAARERFLAEDRARKVAEMTNETQQHPLFDQPQEGRPPAPHEAVTGDWRVDENGMPIKADLSMEAQNLENPMQRNLFGDELPQKHPQEAPTGYMQSMNDTAGALDRSRSLPSIDHFKQMQEEQNALLRHEIPADGRMEAGKLAADTMDPAVRGGNPAELPKFGFDFSKGGSKIPKGQRGAVNPAVFKEGFEKLKQLADGTWLRAHGDGQFLHVELRRDGHNLGETSFSPEYISRHSDERNLKTLMTHVKPEHRGKGYASEMYKFASELGNDVQKSDVLTDSGKKMWDKFEQKGIAKNGMMNKQRGAIDPKVFERMLPEFARSKMRDAEGNLKKFYTGTSKDKDFGEIKPNTRGAWFTDDPKAASAYAKENDSKGFKFQDGKYREVNTADRVHQVYLNLENPYKVTEADHAAMNKENYAGAQRDFFEKLKREGYDGADFGHGTVVAFKPESIKSAISPNGKDKTIKSPGSRQKGAVQMDPSREPERKILDNIPGIQGTLKGLAPSKWTPEQAIEAARMGKDLDQNALQKLSNWFTKGGQYMVDRANNNPVIRYGVEKIAEAERKTRADVANLLHDKDFGLGAATRNMSAAEQTNIWALKNWADHNQKELTPALLREHGATEAQIKYVETHKQVMDHAHEQMNKVWEALGKGSVTKRTSYAAMNASGDYRRLVYDHTGDVVGMVGSDLRWRVNGLKAELEKRGYTVGEEKYVGAKSRDMGNAQAEMQQLLEYFAKDDPRVEELLQTVGDITSSMASKFMNMEVHTKAKKGIFGMDGRKQVGDLEWGGTFLDRNKALANAREGLKAQMNYAEMAIKWGHLTDAIQDVKKVLTDKDVNEKQPMAKQWTNDYISKALGANPTFGRHLEEFAGKLMGETGIGYSNVRSAIAVSRRIVNTVLLGLNPGFWATNVIQPFQAMPGMKALLTSKGLKADFDFGTGWNYIGKGAVDSWNVFRNPEKLTGVLKDAYNYARENHVYGSDLIEHSNHVNKGLSYHSERLSSAASGAIEQDTRAPMYYAFVRMLGENGMTKENGLFETAHNLTDMSMNNYSRTERPKVYDAAGPIGELASNLASYKHNELSRLAMFAREASDGNVRPFLTHLTAAVLYSGVKGVVGYNALDWLIKEISSTQLVNHPTSLTKELMAFSEKLKVAPHVLSHGLFSLMGVDMANRLGLGDALTPSAFPGGSKLADIASAAGSALYHRDEAHTKELAREVAPGVATGPMDLTMFSKGDLGSRKSDLAGSVVRTHTDKVAKAIGFTGIHESVEKQKLYENKWIDGAYTDIRKAVSNTMKGEIYMNKTPTAKSIQKYMDARGDVGSLLKEIDRIGKEQNMSAKDRDMLRASTLRTAAAQGHLQDLTESFNENK